jgi:hypothetical protein
MALLAALPATQSNWTATTGGLIVFDRLFGTFREQRAGIRVRYGLAEPLSSLNPVRIAFHAWWRMARDLRLARGLRERLWLLAGPPGYVPGGTGRDRSVAAAGGGD